MELTLTRTVGSLLVLVGALAAVFLTRPMPTDAAFVALGTFLVFGALFFLVGVLYGVHRATP